MREIFIHGRSVICSLGENLDQAVATLRAKHAYPYPSQALLPDGSTRPYFKIQACSPAHENWSARCERLVQQAMLQASPSHFDKFPHTEIVTQQHKTPLIIASSSIHLGKIEQPGSLMETSQAFANQVGETLAWQGSIYLVPVACTASTQAMLMAQQFISSGIANDVVVLGIELFSRVTVSGFAAMALLSQTSAKPLGESRDGMVLGEAVSVMHLSNRPSRWQMMGGASIVSGQNPTGAEPELVARTCETTIKNSGLHKNEIDMIKLQAAGSPQNDVNELLGLSKIFGETLPALTTLKHLVGHTLGASGITELLLLMACLEQGIKPYYPYYLDKTLPLAQNLQKYCPSVRHLLAVTLGFGGEHAAVLLRDTLAQTK